MWVMASTENILLDGKRMANNNNIEGFNGNSRAKGRMSEMELG